MSISIPAFHVSDQSEVKGGGDIFIASRKSGTTSGIFSVKIAAHFNPADPYPVGALTIKVDLSDGAVGAFNATSIELINSYGKHNPTVFMTGQCKGDLSTAGVPAPQGLRYWLMIADNSTDGATHESTPDIVGFAVHDRNGNRVAYGTGPVKSGDFKVTPK